MNNIIIYKLFDNMVGVMWPAPYWTGTIEDLIKKDLPLNTPYKLVTQEYISSFDLDFQSSWVWNDVLGIEININRAKEIQKNKFRAARKPILEKLDIEFMRALEAGDIQKQQEIASKKQALRDVTNTSLPNDLEGIKNTWPNALNS